MGWRVQLSLRRTARGARARRTISMASPRLTALLLAVIWAAPAVAQYTQYTAPGDLPFPELPTRERFELALSEARWDVGPLRLDPWFSVREIAWTNNVFVTAEGDTVDDVTATVGAGVHGYSRAGSDVILAFHALPEYVWWRKLENRRVWNGRYGLGAFGFFNRLRFETTATTGRQTQYLSSEVEQPVNVRRNGLAAGLEVDLPGRFAVFGSRDLIQWRYREEDAAGEIGEQLVLLDRDEDRFRAGVRYAFTDHLRIGLGVEIGQVDFVRPERDRSSSGTSPMLELAIDGRHVDIQVLLIAADLEPEGDSEFVPYDDPLGRVQLRWKPRAKLEWQLYARSNLVYSLIDESPYYTDRRLGLAALMPFGHRAAGRVFVEAGTNQYAPLADAEPREDDVTAYGAGLVLNLTKEIVFYAGATRTETDRGAGVGTRTVDRILVGLTLGSGTSEWW